MKTNPFRYCPNCAAPGPGWSEGKRAQCQACGYLIYMNSATATAAFITRGTNLLLAVRGRDPGKGLLDLPGGFVDPGAAAEEGLVRELHEELGLKLPPDRLSFGFSFANQYAYHDIIYDTCDLFFHLELLSGDPEPVAGDDVASLIWLDPVTLDPRRLAFDSMRRALARFSSGAVLSQSPGHADQGWLPRSGHPGTQ